MNAHKCSNCGTPGHRATYCPKCMAIYRKVNKWLTLHRGGHTIKATETPAGTVYHFVGPDVDVKSWLSKRGKLPDLYGFHCRAQMMSVHSIVSGE